MICCINLAKEKCMWCIVRWPLEVCVDAAECVSVTVGVVQLHAAGEAQLMFTEAQLFESLLWRNQPQTLHTHTYIQRRGNYWYPKPHISQINYENQPKELWWLTLSFIINVPCMVRGLLASGNGPARKFHCLHTELQDLITTGQKSHDGVSVNRSNKAVSGISVNDHLREPSLSSAGWVRCPRGRWGLSLWSSSLRWPAYSNWYLQWVKQKLFTSA